MCQWETLIRCPVTPLLLADVFYVEVIKPLVTSLVLLCMMHIILASQSPIRFSVGSVVQLSFKINQLL